jgi:hypothetical protein
MAEWKGQGAPKPAGAPADVSVLQCRETTALVSSRKVTIAYANGRGLQQMHDCRHNLEARQSTPTVTIFNGSFTSTPAVRLGLRDFAIRDMPLQSAYCGGAHRNFKVIGGQTVPHAPHPPRGSIPDVARRDDSTSQAVTSGLRIANSGSGDNAGRSGAAPRPMRPLDDCPIRSRLDQ